MPHVPLHDFQDAVSYNQQAINLDKSARDFADSILPKFRPGPNAKDDEIALWMVKQEDKTRRAELARVRWDEARQSLRKVPDTNITAVLRMMLVEIMEET